MYKKRLTRFLMHTIYYKNINFILEMIWLLKIVTFNIVITLNEGKKYLGIFLDLKRTFDTVRHEILLNNIYNKILCTFIMAIENKLT